LIEQGNTWCGGKCHPVKKEKAVEDKLCDGLDEKQIMDEVAMCPEFGTTDVTTCSECLQSNKLLHEYTWCKNIKKCWKLSDGLAFKMSKCHSSYDNYIFDPLNCTDKQFSSVAHPLIGVSCTNCLKNNKEHD